MSSYQLVSILNLFNKRLLIILFLRLLAILFHFLVSIFVVRNLGSEAAGIYFTAFAVIMIIGVIGRLGTENAVVKIVSELENDSNPVAINENVFFIVLCVASCTTLLSVVTAFGALLAEYYGWILFSGEEFYRTLIVFSCGLLSYNVMIVLAQVFLGKQHQITSIIYLNIFWLSVFSVLQFIVKPKTSIEAAWLFNISVISCSLVSILHWACINGIPRSIAGAAKQKIVQLCSNLFGAEFFQQLSIWAPILVVGYYLTAKDVTDYTIAARIAMIAIVVMQASNSYFSPKFAGFLSRESVVSLQNLYARASYVVIFLSLPVIGVLFIWSKFFVGLYDIFSGEAVLYLRILLVGQLFNILAGVAAVLLVMNGGDRYYRIVAAINMIVSIGLSVVFCLYFGAAGVAAGVAISLVVTNIFVLFFMNQFLGFWCPKRLNKKVAKNGN